MSIIETLKRWLGIAKKPVNPVQQSPTEITTPLPNGRVAVVDEKGNFLRFKP